MLRDLDRTVARYAIRRLPVRAFPPGKGEFLDCNAAGPAESWHGPAKKTRPGSSEKVWQAGLTQHRTRYIFSAPASPFLAGRGRCALTQRLRHCGGSALGTDVMVNENWRQLITRRIDSRQIPKMLGNNDLLPG